MLRPRACPPYLAALGLLALAALPARAQFAGFTWELKGGVSGSGTIEPDHLHIVGPDESSDCTPPDGGTTWFETTAPMAGHVSAVVEYITLDDWPSYKLFDAPAWVIDGKVNIPPSGEGWPNGTYLLEFDVLPLQTFGFGVWAADCGFGPGIADVVELVFTPAEWFVLGAPIDPQLGPHLGGTRLAAAGDVNGDGHDDVVTGKQGGGGTPGTVRVWSGLDGSVLFEKTGEKLMGYSVAGGGDFDADGVSDFAGGDPAQSTVTDGAVVAWSGATGAVVFEWPDSPALDAVGVAIASVGDTDGDGFDDLAVSSGGLVSEVGVLGGPDGHLIGKYASGVTKDSFGSTIAGVGDADLDGVPDVLVGAPAVVGSASLNGRAYLYSGATGALLQTLEGDQKQFGLTVSAAGDSNEDGHADLLVADPFFAPDGVHIGRAAIFSGLDGALLLQVTGAPGSVLAGRVSGGRDLSGDDLPDILSAVWLPAITLRVYSGSDTSLIHEFVVPGYSDFDLVEVAMVGDIGADGPADAGISTTIGCFLVKALDGLGPPHLAGSGDVVGEAQIVLAVDHGLAGAPALLVVGATGLNQPLLGGVLVPWPDTLVPFTIGSDGSALLQGRWPPGSPAGTSAWLQAWIVDPAGPAGWTCTNGLIAGQLGS